MIECGNGKILVESHAAGTGHGGGIGALPFARRRPGDCRRRTAGLAAAVYASSEGLSTLMLDRLGPGGQAGGSSRIENFIGFPAGLSGADLATARRVANAEVGARIVTPVEVEKFDPAPGKRISCDSLGLRRGDPLPRRSARARRSLAAARSGGRGPFAGAGIYYACTTVEADLYDGTDVAVVGGGNSAGQAVVFLAECCPTRTVHLLVRRTLGPQMSEYLCERIRAAPNVVIHEQTVVEAVHGNRHIEAITLKDTAEQATRQVPCSAVFVFVGAEPAADWLPAEMAGTPTAIC